MKNLWKQLDKNVQKLAATVAAIVTIGSALIAGGSFLISQLDSAVAVQLDKQTDSIQADVKELSDKVDAQDRQTDLQLTRLELMTLMDNNPYNVVEIEKVARHYFNDLKGDWYLSELYSTWAKTYGGDISIMLE